MSRTDYKPEARKKQLIARKTEGELLVYDTERHRAHSLDAPLAALWRACDGTKSVGELAQKLELPEAALWIALERLSAARLLRAPLPSAAPASAPSRREWLRTATALGLGLASITVPRLSEAATLINPGQCNQRTAPNCGGQTCSGGGGVCRVVVIGNQQRCRCG